MGSQRVRHDWATLTFFHGCNIICLTSGLLLNICIVFILFFLLQSTLQRTSWYFYLCPLCEYEGKCYIQEYSPLSSVTCTWSFSPVWLFCNSMDYNLPGPSVYGILQIRILKWAAMPSSEGSSQLRDWTQVSCISRWILYHWASIPWHLTQH